MLDKLKVPHLYTLIILFVLFASVLTYIVPSGEYSYYEDETTGRSLVIPGSYHRTEKNPVGLFDFLLSVPRGMNETAQIIFFILLIGGTGIIGRLKGGIEGPVLAVRADTDALQFDLNGGRAVVHACGHDAHSAMVLAMAGEIAERGVRRGSLVIVFQPAEETLAGARAIIASDELDEIDEIIGIHLRPAEELSYSEATPYLYHSAVETYKVVVKGRYSHGGRPHLGINAAEACVLATNAINAIRINPAVSHSVKVTGIHAGMGATNNIPENAEIIIDVRAQTNDAMKELLAKMKAAVINSVMAIGAEAVLNLVSS